jgi:hypothetical protein
MRQRSRQRPDQRIARKSQLERGSRDAVAPRLDAAGGVGRSPPVGAQLVEERRAAATRRLDRDRPQLKNGVATMSTVISSISTMAPT